MGFKRYLTLETIYKVETNKIWRSNIIYVDNLTTLKHVPIRPKNISKSMA